MEGRHSRGTHNPFHESRPRGSLVLLRIESEVHKPWKLEAFWLTDRDDLESNIMVTVSGRSNVQHEVGGIPTRRQAAP